jgi:3-hydroxyisobutyrate dehydrogenase
MSHVGFIGLGHMGCPMARNLIKAGHAITGFDIDISAADRLSSYGGVVATSVDVACAGVDVVITVLPSAKEVRAVYLGHGGILASAAPGTLLIDCSTTDVEASRAVAAAAAINEMAMVDAPGSGGIADAEAATLTFMVGGSAAAFERASALLSTMGKTVVHAGGAGAGQAAKVCNSMILGVSMISVSEAIILAEKLGLDRQKLFEIVSQSLGQCWSTTSMSPATDSTSHISRDNQAGLPAATMLKDLRFAQSVAKGAGAKVPMAAGAGALYDLFVNQGSGAADFSGIVNFLRGS